MLTVSSECNLLGHALEGGSELSCAWRTKDMPFFVGNGNHHAVVGAANFEREVVSRYFVCDFFAVHRAERSLEHRDGIEDHQRQAEGEQCSAWITQCFDLAFQRRR